jgi:hypothetical protein
LLQIQRCRTKLRANSPRLRLSHLYNEFILPLNLNQCTSMFVLKKSLRSLLT